MKNWNSKTISDMVNSSDWKPMEVGVELTSDHPYLQQQLFEMMMHFIRQTAENYKRGWYDGRNSHASKCCKVMIEATDNADLTFFGRWEREKYKTIIEDLDVANRSHTAMINELCDRLKNVEDERMLELLLPIVGSMSVRSAIRSRIAQLQKEKQ